MKSFPRLVLAATISFAVGNYCAAATSDDFSEHVGLQLESLKRTIRSDLPGTLAKAHDFGFKYVELVGDYNLSPAALTAELKAHGLVATSAHFPYDKFRDNPEAIATEAVELGLTYTGCPSIPPKEALDEKSCLEAIAVFNHAGEVLAAHGLKFFYHPHGYEFKPHGTGTFFDLLMEKTNPKYVHFQMDIFWIVHAGQDPVKLLERYPNRWVSLHLKDMKNGARTGQANSKAPVGDFVPVGQGMIDLPGIVRTAQKLGITSFFVEDESANPEFGIPPSVRYLRQLKW